MPLVVFFTDGLSFNPSSRLAFAYTEAIFPDSWVGSLAPEVTRLPQNCIFDVLKYVLWPCKRSLNAWTECNCWNEVPWTGKERLLRCMSYCMHLTGEFPEIVGLPSISNNTEAENSRQRHFQESCSLTAGLGVRVPGHGCYLCRTREEDSL